MKTKNDHEVERRNIEQWDLVDNAIFDMIEKLNPSAETKIEWTTDGVAEARAEIRETLIRLYCEKLKLCTEEKFYGTIEDEDMREEIYKCDLCGANIEPEKMEGDEHLFLIKMRPKNYHGNEWHEKQEALDLCLECEATILEKVRELLQLKASNS